MRKIISVCFSLLLLVTSCQIGKEEPMTAHPGRYAEGRATIRFSIDACETVETKAGVTFTTQPQINSLKLAVFDEEGYLSEVVPATLVNPDHDKGNYYATVALSYEHRIIHFLANYDEEIPFGTEEEAIASIYTEDKYDAYWRRIDLPDGLTVQADNNGDPLTDANGIYIFDESVADALEDIVLIRNFARFTITNTSSNLEIESACIVGAGNVGAVAPYNRSTSEFINNYDDFATPAALIASSYSYDGCIPERAHPTTLSEATWSDYGHDDFVDKYCCVVYSYERETPSSDPAFIIVRAKYGTTPGERDANGSSYYKINLRDGNGNYFPILRNFDYKINISNVSKAGYASAQEAIDGPGSGDISTDINYLDLANISNGEARIFVSYTDKVLVSGNPVELKFKFIPNMAAPTTTANGSVSITRGESGYYGDIFGNDSDIAIDLSRPDSDGYVTATLDPRDPDQFNRTQTLKVTGTYTKNENNLTISRIISFTLRQMPDIIASCTPSEVSKTSGQRVTVSFSIPGGLSESMFPLAMKIEAEKMTITPNKDPGISAEDKNLPSGTGMSVFNSNLPACYFIRTITWDEYNSAGLVSGRKLFKAEFKTNTALSGSRIKVYDDEYFAPGETAFSSPIRLLFNGNPVDLNGGTDFTGVGMPIANQPFYLVGYADVENLDGLTIGGKSATYQNASINIGGTTYYKYRTSSSISESFGKYTYDIECRDYSNPGQPVKVYGVNREDSYLTSVSHSASKYYIFVNNAFPEYHLFANANNNNIAGRNNNADGNTSYDYYSLFKFTNANGNSTIYVPSKNKSIVGRYNENFGLANTGRTYTFDGNNDGYSISIYYNRTTRYWYQNRNTDNVSMNSNATKFLVYPAEFVEPQ